ncbi:5'-methylthioadenosine/S-adenosylhomocysteine nucleosidase [Campylobacter sp. FMV-PI01]|uniref:5'-methylthioadenosine/S-adenosylhomocysteine nucleosidase n=1 Tax=Campylobacter portucalensis TaxID=2608384 RepID=A0A6L5WHR8_9BACT|nr:purine-nucleoside phosphorylase [Campylobacter portucalensis]MSN95777.1 5'-methylthioadenosine/S-adenosylhomocysteine nucleosidase [Campylobacter portucalensis]
MENLLICAGGNENFDFAKGVGIGLVDSAINLTHMLLKMDKMPKKIIFIGTAGIYKDGEILKIYECFYASNLEISKILGLSYTPLNMDKICNVPRETLSKNRSDIVVNSSNFITTDKKSALKFSDYGLMLENMEFFSILSVANKFKIPCYALLCATNFCDENAHNDFLKNHYVAKKRLENYMKEKGLI